ncbi:MAG TPA: SDR family oxidoreductase [Actinobacteria bacterium]|nr:3-oxoacyl-[acyl-carrier-protein] reductase FabG1 [bacterium BMS3Bbin01]HDK46181.1 SDR family oxidoreductase [Actinomycetota bacterium]HDL49631.1 SDR family oxidoreductase [Actinomycetota bacterium]
MMTDRRVLVITGATGGLGTALVRRLTASDYRFAATYLVPEEARVFEETVLLGEDRLLLARVDAADTQEVEAFMQNVAERFGAIDALCCLAGKWAGGRDVADTDDVRFDRMIDTNLRSAFVAVRAALPYLKMAHWGRILLMGSRAAVDAPAGQAAFNVAKAGVVALAKSLAQELGGDTVTANVILPSVIDTPATRKALPYADYMDWPTPDEIAAVMEFMLSEASGTISGAAIPVYGKA